MATNWIDPQIIFKVIQIKGTSGNANGMLEYFCEAEPGVTTATAVWRIKKMVYDSDGFLTQILFADGDRKFDNIQDNYASISYS